MPDSPRCSGGDYPHEPTAMELRPREGQTYEQKFCGVWFDCPICNGAVLEVSERLCSLLEGGAE